MKHYPFFKHQELQCRCGCESCNMDEVFMAGLVWLREKWEKPLIVNSAFRCQTHNDHVGGYPKSAHLQGQAVDLKCHKEERAQLMALAFQLHFSGFGIGETFIHIDNKQRPSKQLWFY